MIATRVLIADDDTSMREALSAVIDSDPSLYLVGCACDAQEAITMAVTYQPDVIVLDVRMPFGGGARAATEIRCKSPRTKILAFSAYGDLTTVLDLVRRGANGYLIKGSAPSELLQGIHDACSGTSPLSPVVAQEVVGHLSGMMRKEERMEEQALARLTRLQQAMQDGTRIAYQPILHLADRQVIGFEALSRFSANGLPAEWFAQAASAGLTIDFELSCLIRSLASRPRQSNAYLSLNASPESILSGRLQPLLATSPNLVIEISERALIPDYKALNEALAPLRALGVRLAIDDAGSGLLGLRHIILLQPQLVKLDFSLVHQIDTSASQRALARTLVTFAHSLNATVVAEGIESQAELEVLLALGVECGQGYLLGRPHFSA